MTEKQKQDLTRTEVGRMIDAEVREELAKLQRPSRAMKALNDGVDITAKYPLAAWAIGVAFIAGGIIWFDGAKMWTLVGVGVCFVPGLARKAIDLVTGLKKAKGD